MNANRKIILRLPVAGQPKPDDFTVVTAPRPDPAEGEALIRHEWLSLDPYMGSAIKGRHMSGAITPGDVMPGETIGTVVASRSSALPIGATVISRGGWQLYSVASPADPREQGIEAALSSGARLLDVRSCVSPSAYLGVLGMPGLTAFAGVVDMLQPKPGETFVVSAASGAVGSAAGQIARNMGATVIGIAGSDEKCAEVVGTFGFDGCVNYRTPAWKADLARLCPDGIHAYFDTAGGDIIKAAMARLAMRGRILLCGMMDQYNSAAILPGPSLAPVLQRRATISGLVVYDHWHRMESWRAIGVRWLAEGRLRYREQRVPGLDLAPGAFADLMAGRNFGKVVVKLASL